ncbi:MAG: fatty acid--CoA ligase family protein [Planctomycetota bacterium]
MNPRPAAAGVDDPIVRAFQGLLAREPDAVCVRQDERTATRRDIEALAHAAASRLGHARLPAGATVALAAPNGPGFLAGLLGCLLARHPVLLLDAEAAQREGPTAAAHLGAAALLSCSAWPPPRAPFALCPLTDAVECVAPTGTTVLKLTSGSTGRPRAAAFTSQALLADCAQIARTMDIPPHDRLLATVPMSFSYGLGNLTLPALANGNELVVADALNPVATLAAAARADATVFPAVPVFLQTLLRLTIRSLPPKLRLIISAGAPLSTAAARAFRARFARPVHTFYGSSECGGISYDRTGSAAERGSVGTPIDGVRLELADDGILAVHSPAVATGYVPDPGDDALRAGRFRTADCAAIDPTTNEVRLLGRRSDVVNVGGRKVYPGEIEDVVAQIPGVEDVVVFGETLEDRATEVCHAVIVVRPDVAVTPRTVRDHCAKQLAAHKVPKLVSVVPEIPRTERGKLDHARLRGSPTQPGATS